jgi:hypothetical protein
LPYLTNITPNTVAMRMGDKTSPVAWIVHTWFIAHTERFLGPQELMRRYLKSQRKFERLVLKFGKDTLLPTVLASCPTDEHEAVLENDLIYSFLTCKDTVIRVNHYMVSYMHHLLIPSTTLTNDLFCKIFSNSRSVLYPATRP